MFVQAFLIKYLRCIWHVLVLGVFFIVSPNGDLSSCIVEIIFIYKTDVSCCLFEFSKLGSIVCKLNFYLNILKTSACSMYKHSYYRKISVIS